jgi:hypothetical protein
MPAATAARRGRALPAPVLEPLPPREQLCQDVTIALGPVAAAFNLAITLHDAGLISRAWSLSPEALAAVPSPSSSGTQPPGPRRPPASAARRALVRAATALTLLVNAAGVGAALIGRRTPGTWVTVAAPAGFCLFPLMAAYSAGQRNRARPRAATATGTPSEPAERPGA